MSVSKKAVVKGVIVFAAVAFAGTMCLLPTFVTPHVADTLLQQGAAPDAAAAIALAAQRNMAAQRCLGVFVICLALWFTNVIPLAATALLALALFPLLHILPVRVAFGFFGNTALFFILGVFLLAGAMISTGLSKRITLLALQRFDKSPGRLVAGVTVSSSFLAMWMPEHAVAAMIYPILVEVVDSLKLAKGAAYARKLFLGLAWGSIIGGVGTFLGGARAPVAIDLLKQHTAHRAEGPMTIGFIPWMIAALPVVIILTVVAVFTLKHRIRDDVTDVTGATKMLDERVRRLGPMSGPEKRLALLGILTIVVWITLGEQIGLAVVATVSAVMLFVLRIVDWQTVQGYVNWNVLIMYGGAVALGMTLTETRALEWVAHRVIDPSMPRLALLMMMVVASMALTESISNTAAVAVLLPIGYTLGDMVGMNPAMMTLVVTIPAGLAFILPVSAPPNAICFSAGHYNVREVMGYGWPMTASTIAVMFLVITIWWEWILNVYAW